MTQYRNRTIGLLGGIGLVLSCAAPASAQLYNAGTFRNLTNEQTGPNTVVSTGAFFNAGGLFTSPGDYTTFTLTDPGPGSPENLPLNTPTSFGNGPSFATQADMDAAYPFGTYVIAVSGGTQPDTSVTLHYTADAYTSDVPQLSATSFNDLLGLSTGLSSLTLNFNAFTPSPLVTTALAYFTIFGSSQFCSGLAPSAGSCTIDPQALTPGKTYAWELDFSDRIENTVDGALTYTDFDVRTDGSFTTKAIPEPSTWAMGLIGFVGLGYATRRARTRRATA
jgi:hypothetical protein